tara:strand:+ start:304 stop:462 length:159 start_codon:yes stop_codon:yes gene_type:complete
MILNIFTWICTIIAIASFIAAITPTPQGNWWLSNLYKVVDWCALNIGKAKDK